MDLDKRSLELIRQVEAKRGYLLPYHELFLLVDPALLEAYDRLYENLTLKTRHLDQRTKEIVWLGILISVQEEAGTLHLERAREAGLRQEEIGRIIALSQVAMGVEAVTFIKDWWQDHLPEVDPWAGYGRLVEAAGQDTTLHPKAVELMFIGIYSALTRKEALRFHLRRAGQYGLRDEEIGEAMSFALIPRGGNVLIEAAQVLKELVIKGQYRPSSVFRYWLDRPGPGEPSGGPGSDPGKA